ncbi:MAG TPA: hypothetical protein VM096_04840 [Vicinamibacterales bacterium]|nr:hypothetical protein [Vicinamibacterales bacterium]
MGAGTVTPLRICLTFDIDLVGYASGDEPVDEFANAIPSLLSIFDRHPSWTATWFVRIDDQIAATSGSAAAILDDHAQVIGAMRARGHEIGWHPHSYMRSRDGAWRQNTDEASVIDELSRLAPVAHAHGCRAVRCGWGFHTNRTMRTVADAGFAIDSSAIPRPRYRWETSIKDWTTTPLVPYRPSAADYRVSGEPALPILEVPMSVAVVRSPTDTEVVLRYLNPSFHHHLFAPALAAWWESHDHLVTVTHPYEVMQPGTNDALLSYDAGTLESNIALIEHHARESARPLTFMTLSQFASTGWAA